MDSLRLHGAIGPSGVQLLLAIPRPLRIPARHVSHARVSGVFQIGAKPAGIWIHYASMGQLGLQGSNFCWLYPGRSVYLQGMCPMREFRAYFSVVTRTVTSGREVTLRCRRW